MGFIIEDIVSDKAEKIGEMIKSFHRSKEKLLKVNLLMYSLRI